MKNINTPQHLLGDMIERAMSTTLGRPLRLIWLPRGAHLGYTQQKPLEINVAFDHEVLDGLTPREKNMVRMGVSVHETLHQLLTDFITVEQTARTLTRGEMAIFMQFANCNEDCSIEFFAPAYFGGVWLKALRFTIGHTYKCDPGLGKDTHPFYELIHALILFGDMGFVKGEWVFPEAKEYFNKIAPLFNEAVEEPFAPRRVQIYKEEMEVCRPLWEPLLKEQEEFEKLLKEALEALAKMAGGGSGTTADSPGNSGETGTASRRRTLVASMSGGGSRSEGSDGSSGSDGNGEGGAGDETSSDSSSASKPNASPEGDSAKEAEIAKELASEYEVDDETLEEVESTLEKLAEQKAKAEKAETDSKETPLPDFKISCSNGCLYKEGKAVNVRPTLSANCSMAYKKYVSQNEGCIKSLVRELSRIFDNDQDEVIHKTSGKYNLLRGEACCSANVFDKRQEAVNKKDTAVVLCVDQSGSMSHNNKMEAAKIATIVLAEAFTRLNIPYYVMGFTADEKDNYATHIHWVDWRNKKTHRESLVGMEARADNFDGYSIRYATELLKKRPERQKVTFVISDGQPACYFYNDSDSGIADTATAIKSASKIATIFGIGIGKCGPTVLQKMYGSNFIHVPNPFDVATMLSRQIKRVFKSFDC